jgi:hypothetical protein
MQPQDLEFSPRTTKKKKKVFILVFWDLIFLHEWQGYVVPKSMERNVPKSFIQRLLLPLKAARASGIHRVHTASRRGGYWTCAEVNLGSAGWPHSGSHKRGGLCPRAVPRQMALLSSPLTASVNNIPQEIYPSLATHMSLFLGIQCLSCM